MADHQDEDTERWRATLAPLLVGTLPDPTAFRAQTRAAFARLHEDTFLTVLADTHRQLLLHGSSAAAIDPESAWATAYLFLASQLNLLKLLEPSSTEPPEPPLFASATFVDLGRFLQLAHWRSRPVSALLIALGFHRCTSPKEALSHIAKANYWLDLEPGSSLSSDRGPASFVGFLLPLGLVRVRFALSPEISITFSSFFKHCRPPTPEPPPPLGSPIAQEYEDYLARYLSYIESGVAAQMSKGLSEQDARVVVNGWASTIRKKRILHGILNDSPPPPVVPEVHSLPWELLPPGAALHVSTLAALLSPVDTSPKTRRPSHGSLRTRLDLILQLGPDKVYRGLGHFTGYLAFVFSSLELAVLDSPDYGNALYVFDRNWEELSRFSKEHLVSNELPLARLVHSGPWSQRLRALIRERRNSRASA